MDKNFLRDGIPHSRSVSQKKSIRNIPLSENAARKASVSNGGINKDFTKIKRRKVGKKSFKKIIALVIVLIVIGYFAFSLSRAQANITLIPESSERSVDLSMNIYREGFTDFEEGVDVSEHIPYTIEEVSVVQSTSVPASGEEEVEDKASGTITVFNEYSTEPQTLIANTRFESPDGKIYRIQKAINIPGMSGGNPGTLDIEVLADEAGIEYNKDSAGVDFTIPGLKSTPEQYSKMYAKSKTGITGGYSGIRKVVSEEDEESTRESLKSDLVTSIENKVSELNVDDKFAVYNSKYIQYTSQNDEVDGESVKISEKASVTTLVFDKKIFSEKIAALALRNTEDTSIVINNLEELNIFIDTSESFDPSVDNTGILRIEGDAQFVWDLDIDKLKDSFAGISKSELTEMLSNASGVSRARISIDPFWKQSVPKDLEKINIEVNIEETEE